MAASQSEGPTAPIRVLHVVSGLVVAGMEYGVVKLLNRLDRARFQPMIACLRSQHERARALVAVDTPVFQVGDNETSDYELITRLIDLFRRERVDIVHTHNWQSMLVGVVAGRLAGAPLVVHGEHGHETTGTPWRRLLLKRALAQVADALVCVSGDLKRELEEEWKIPRHRITFIPNGVDTDRFRPMERSETFRAALGLAANSRVLVNVGGIRTIKDHPTLIRALALLRARVPGTQLVIVGSDYHRNLKSELETLATSLGVLDAIVFAGIRADVPEILSVCDVYVNSSRFEGMSNTILEAMACGVPVVATDVGGTPELVQNRVTGRLVPAADPERMASVLEEILADREGSQRMAEAARDRIATHHSMDAMVEANARLYADLRARKLVRRSATVSQTSRRWIAEGLRATGALRKAAGGGSGELAILMYHRVLPLDSIDGYPFRAMTKPRDIFRAEVAHLSRHAAVLTLSDAMDRLRSGTLPRQSVVITFDDAYRDNYTVAWPILREFGLPATVFVVTGAVDGSRRLWWDDVDAWIQALWRRREIPPGLSAILPAWVATALAAGGSGDPRRIAERLVRELCDVPRETRRCILSALREALGSDANGAPLLASWDELRAMHREGIELGSHTVTHQFLDELDADEAAYEIEESAVRIEREIGARPRSFSYPRGRILETARPLLDRSRIEWSVTTRPGLVRRGDDPHDLVRISTGLTNLSTGFSESLFRLELQGWWLGLRARQGAS